MTGWELKTQLQVNFNKFNSSTVDHHQSRCSNANQQLINWSSRGGDHLITWITYVLLLLLHRVLYKSKPTVQTPRHLRFHDANLIHQLHRINEIFNRDDRSSPPMCGHYNDPFDDRFNFSANRVHYMPNHSHYICLCLGSQDSQFQLNSSSVVTSTVLGWPLQIVFWSTPRMKTMMMMGRQIIIDHMVRHVMSVIVHLSVTRLCDQVPSFDERNTIDGESQLIC